MTTMSHLSSFTLFPLLPVELRNYFYASCIQPRIVHLETRRWTRFTHFWSRSPIPVLLHTCRESRRTMQVCGYELAFATETTKPLTWYNFKHDMLFLGYIWSTTGTCLPPREWSTTESCLQSRDKTRLERLAVSQHWEENDVISTLISFAHVKELFLKVDFVAGHMSFTNRGAHFLLDTEADPVGYLEADTPEFLAYPKFPVPYYRNLYQSKISEYRAANGGNYDGFFSEENNAIETSLLVRKGASSVWSVPTTKHVYFVTRRQARGVLAFRERFRAKTRNEEEEGLILEPDVPFDADLSDAPFEDDLEAMRAAYESEFF